MKKQFLLLLGFILLLSACQKPAMLTISGNQDVNISCEAYKFTVTVQSNRAWTSKAAEAWLHVTPFSVNTPSEDGIQVTISVDENNSYDERSATITFMAEDVAKEIKIKQGSRHALVLPQESRHYNLSAEGKKIDVEVWTNAEYDIIIDADWIKRVDSKALPERHHMFQIEENGSRQERVGNIRFVNEAEGIDATVDITQNYYPILVSRDLLNVSGRGWRAVIETVYPTPEDYTIEMEDRWLTLEGSEKKEETSCFYVSAAPLAEGAEPRDSRIFVYYKGLKEPDTLMVHQFAPLPILGFSYMEMEVTVPKLDGDKAIGLISWGDGTNDVWKEGLKHKYTSAGPHDVQIELSEVRRAVFSDMKDEMSINLKEMRK